MPCFGAGCAESLGVLRLHRVTGSADDSVALRMTVDKVWGVRLLQPRYSIFTEIARLFFTLSS